MVESKAVTTKLFVNSILDVKDELDERLEKCHGIVLGQVNNFSEREGLDSLQVFASRSQSHHDDVQLGLLYGILSDPTSAIKYYRMMTLVCQDGLGKVVGTANQLIYEKWIKLNDVCRTQLTWLSKELIHNSVARADTVCHYLLRQIAGGDLSVRNISLTETMLDILSENRAWLDKNPNFIPVAVYTFLRIIIDHQPPALHNLRQKEVEFCIGLLREKWAECQVIGRDLVRLLQGVARINEFMELWKDIHFNPTTLSPQFSGVKQLMQMKTSRSYFVSRLTPDMETKLGFLTMQVRFGNQKRYQDWFQRQYLSTPESQSLRCDLIRYICTVIHPTNEILCSDIIPRWAVIGWLLTTCTSNVAASNAKLALFYDWLFYDAERDNIMNIEPCILVMYNSMRPHPAITATLLDFMCRIMHNFCPSLTPFVRHGIYASLNSILEKRVLPSLAPLFNNPKMDKDLYSMLKENFPEFCSTESSKQIQNNQPSSKTDHSCYSPSIKEEAMMREQTTDVITNHLENNSTPAETAAFSDDDDNSSTAPKQDSKPGSTKTQNSTFDIDAILSNLEEAVKELVVQMNSESDKEVQCEVMDKLLQKIVRQDFDQEDATNLAKCLCHVFSAYFQGKLVPQEMDDESVEESIGMPLFVIFRNIHQTPDEDPSRQTIMMLLEEMYKIQPKIGYYFLYFLKASSRVQHEAKMSAYKDFCKTMENKLDFYLLADLKLCYEDDEIKLISYLVPDIYSQFSSLAVGNIDMLHLIVSSIDGAQLLDLICEILQGHLVMFAKDSFISVLNASLQWETCEQYFLWQLISAHKIPVNLILPILPKLEFTVHSEAITSITILLKQDCPTAEILRPLLCRECKKNDLFTVSLLRFWAQEYGDKLADLLHTQLTRCNGTPSKKKLSRSNKVKDKDQPSTEQILSHLDHMRLACKDISFLSNESIQQALQNVQTSCSEALKVKFGDLLALVEDVEEAKSTRVLRQVPSRRASQAATKSSVSATRPGKRGPAEDSDTSSETSEDEESVQVSKNKKIKRAVLFDD